MENENDLSFNNWVSDDSSSFFSFVPLEELSGDQTITEEESALVLDVPEYSYFSLDSSDCDYSIYLEDIISNQETIISQYDSFSLQLQDITDNSFRLYYFIGGLYVAFAIVLAIKFFKMFF